MNAPHYQPLPSPANGFRPLPGGTGHRPVAAGDPPAARACAGSAARSSKVFCAETRRQVAAENGQVGRSTGAEFDRSRSVRGIATAVPAACSRRPSATEGKELLLSATRAHASSHGGAVPAISRGVSDSDTPGLAAKHQAPLRGARLTARDGRKLAPLRGALPIARHTGGVVAALLNPRLLAGSLSGCFAAGSTLGLPTACAVCEPSPFAERGEKVAGGRMRGFLPVGDDVRSLTSNADCRMRNAEPSQSLLTSAPTSQGNPSPRPSPLAPQREREGTFGSISAENCGTVSCARKPSCSARGRAEQQPGRLRSTMHLLDGNSSVITRKRGLNAPTPCWPATKRSFVGREALLPPPSD